MVKTKDYRKTEIPENEEYENWSVDQRRALIYSDALEHGGTRSLPKTYEEYGDMFDIDVSMVWKDVNSVRESILEFEFTRDKVREDIASTLLWINKKAKEEEDMDLLRKTSKTYKKWAQDLGIEEKEPEKHEVEHKGGVADKMADIYKEKKQGDE